MDIDHATLADVPAVARIHVDGWRAAYSDILPADYLAAISVDEREVMWTRTVERGHPELLVARDGDTVLGWVLIGKSRDDNAPPTEAELWAIYVAPGRWSRGIGRQLWARARELLSAQGYSTCSLWVFPENEQAIRFYRSAGFVADDHAEKHLELGGRKCREVRYHIDLRPSAAT